MQEEMDFHNHLLFIVVKESIYRIKVLFGSMIMNKINENIRNYILSDGKFKEPALASYIQSLEEILNKMEAKTMTEARRLEIAKEQVRGIRKQSRRLEERMSLLENENETLQEQIKVIEENKNINEK